MGRTSAAGSGGPQPRLPAGATAAVDFVYLDGALLSAEVVRELDGPRRDYFVMMVDVEYPLRLRAAGVTMVQAGVPYESLRLGATAGGSPWRAYYQTRNHLHLAVSHRSPALLGGFVLRTAKQTAYAIGTGSWDQLAYRWRGVADAVRGRMGRTVEPPSAHPTRQPTGDRCAHLDPARAHVFGRLRRRLAGLPRHAGRGQVAGAPRQRPPQPDGSLRGLDAARADPPHRAHSTASGSSTSGAGRARSRRRSPCVRRRWWPSTSTPKRSPSPVPGCASTASSHVAVHHADSYRDVADQLGSFDLVVAHAVFEHVPLSVPGLRADVLRQAFDALSPGGHLFISESPNRLMPRDIYCTGLWFIPWTRGGSTWAYRRAIRAGRHTDPDGRGPISLEERGAWGFTYWTVRRALRERPHEIVNAQPGHDRWVRYDRRLSAKRRAYESVIYHLVTRTTRTPIVAFAPMLSPLVIRRRS